MEDLYHKMYLTLFQAITSALKAMEQQNFGMAKELLRQSQQNAEDIYIEAGET